MESLLHLTIVTFSALFPITNPLGNAAIFLSLTSDRSASERHRIAFRSCLYTFIILEGFLVCGGFILNFFDLSLAGIRIAGGLLIVKFGFDQLQPKREKTHTDEEHQEARLKEDIAFSPLAMPLIAGPGAIASVMSIVSVFPDHNYTSYLAATIGILLTACVCWTVLRFSDQLLSRLGVNGANALTKIMGFLLLCIGVQLCILGISSVLESAS